MNEYTITHDNSPNALMLVYRERAMCILMCVQIHQQSRMLKLFIPACVSLKNLIDKTFHIKHELVENVNLHSFGNKNTIYRRKYRKRI